MLRRPHYIAVGVVVLLALLVLNLPGRATARLKLAIGSLFLPLFGLATGAQQATSKAGDSIVSRAELARQNELLHRENEQLRLEAMRADEIARENDGLRKLFQWQQQHRWKSRLKLARVILS